ncbi:hypothetical protein A2954_06805 [Candidatus Roizmanbacteria bacterium RIFCSPLOWO2_01_FULL_37_12]|uniref:Non-canonical purine NTP pyrophosphatase n=1 Tax=Candidatus Roizmanbacteria bacterium RIFCSPLOWO2_01_FULL_37_12 TaxID=1802056 RepID=A0A1F7ID86_9BACT|nr:MAG: hypothetical protein A3D76_05800 [Candidatus Roizmanbacteria bacterium RIFCSPHIGHO2_02_FULL_37_9b]OGK41301.1 MAG: hypothetical protein A2954_06805 [Candidatus Roizmanbacteria bacterium RIFCSPLOWO2_01_FULL_37_12]
MIKLYDDRLTLNQPFNPKKFVLYNENLNINIIFNQVGMNKILLATHNKAKLKELEFGLQNLEKIGIKLLTLDYFNITSHPHETGNTFRENAILKAKFYANLTKLPTLADDGGLIIPFLNNEPGVKSRRWLGYEATDTELINYTLQKLKGVKSADRKAYLETCITFYLPARNPEGSLILYEQEKIVGHIAEKAFNNYLEGFPFRALFIVDKFNKYYDELTQKEHKQVNHRLKALERLKVKINKYLIK